MNDNEAVTARVDGQLLLIGDVDYDADPIEGQPGQPRKLTDFRSLAVRGQESLKFAPLRGTRDEIVIAAKEYEDLVDPLRRGITVIEGPSGRRWYLDGPGSPYA